MKKECKAVTNHQQKLKCSHVYKVNCSTAVRAMIKLCLLVGIGNWINELIQISLHVEEQMEFCKHHFALPFVVKARMASAFREESTTWIFISQACRIVQKSSNDQAVWILAGFPHYALAKLCLRFRLKCYSSILINVIIILKKQAC